MIVLVHRNSSLKFPEVLTEVGTDENGDPIYKNNITYAVKLGVGDFVCYDMQPSYEESQAVLSEGGYIFVDKAAERTWLDN